jgi:hypothetical protein
MILTPDPPRPHWLIVNWRSDGAPDGSRECLLMTVRGIVRLNGSATAVWERLDGRRDVPRIAAELAGLYPGAAIGALTPAIEELLDDLTGLGAVVRDWRPLDPCPVSRFGRPGRSAGGGAATGDPLVSLW